MFLICQVSNEFHRQIDFTRTKRTTSKSTQKVPKMVRSNIPPCTAKANNGPVKTPFHFCL